MVKRLAEWFLTVKGGEFHGELPDEDKIIVVGASHTSMR
jgi:hypothetical protein